MKEQREKEERLNHLKQMHEENKRVFDKLDREKMHKKEMYQRMVEERKREEDDYKQYQRRQLEEEEQKRKMYREALEIQKGYKEYNRNHLGQMTQIEKKMNKQDLKAFKQGKTDYEGMIPGIHNIDSIGSRPILRKAHDDMYEASAKAPLFASKDLNRSYKDLRKAIKPLDEFAATHSPEKGDRRYDPITNPIPFVNQNPYILKEKTMIGGEGASSVINTGRRSRRSLLSSTAEKNILI